LKIAYRVVVMGVSGSGKSTVAELLATELQCPMLEGDNLHSAHNIERMTAGHALTDADRQGWLAAIASRIAAAVAGGESLVVSCSALKHRYRDMLRQADEELIFVYLKGSEELIRTRLSRRERHFMPPGLLDSQFQTLEEPTPDEHAIECSIEQSPADTVASILPHLAGLV
jgi:gluconokinase